MALVKCKECGAEISENAESCPRCGIKGGARKSRGWLDAVNIVSGTLTAVFGTLVIPAAGAALAWFTFVYQKNSQENEKLQAMIESAVSQDTAKELTAVRVVSCLAKLTKLPAPFALSLLGTVARSSEDPKLRREAYDAIESLTTETTSFDVEKLDTYDKLEIFCLQAALTPSQYFRQRNLSYIEKYATNDLLEHEVASKLLALSQDVSDPQTKIDLLLTVFIRYNDPDMMERAIPILYSAVKERDPSQSDSNEDILNFLELVAQKNRDDRSQIRLYLIRALVTNNQRSREDYLGKFAIIGARREIRDEAKRLLESITSAAKDDAVLVRILDLASKNLAGEVDKATANITQR
ncbi:MAG: zinc ribbon domain-containing protein [Verrucomicrobia bacterium]|nr:zinc ribbon domain-containing protein [Verrucomicrobiota bacterium]